MGNGRRGYENSLAEVAKQQSNIAAQQFDLYQPNMEYLLNQSRAQLDQGLGKPPGYVREAFNQMEGAIRDEYGRAAIQGQAELEQIMKQQGLSGTVSPAAKAALTQQRQMGFAQQQAQALAQLRMQQANVGMAQTLALADLLRGGTSQAGSMIMGAMGNQMNALQFLAQYGSGNQWGNALSGALSGAASGYAATGTPYGALFGAVAGGVGGYYS